MFVGENSRKKYIISKILTSGDYLAHNFEQSSIFFLLHPFKNSPPQLLFNSSYFISPLETLQCSQENSENKEEQLNGKFICYRIPRGAILIGNLSDLKFKSQLLCCTLLNHIVSQIVVPLLNSTLPVSTILNLMHAENFWMRDK